MKITFCCLNERKFYLINHTQITLLSTVNFFLKLNIQMKANTKLLKFHDTQPLCLVLRIWERDWSYREYPKIKVYKKLVRLMGNHLLLDKTSGKKTKKQEKIREDQKTLISLIQTLSCSGLCEKLICKVFYTIHQVLLDLYWFLDASTGNVNFQVGFLYYLFPKQEIDPKIKIQMLIYENS